MGNSNAWQNGKNSRFTHGNQPKKRGKLKSKFGSLSKENDLSLDDIRKIYKNILTAKDFNGLDLIKEKFPTILTDQTIDMLKQDKLGRLTGKKMTVQDKKKIIGEDENGKPIYAEITVNERIKSYEMIKYMLDRCYGEPGKSDGLQPDDYETPVFVMDELPE
jgi:hypothetical protein